MYSGNSEAGYNREIEVRQLQTFISVSLRLSECKRERSPQFKNFGFRSRPPGILLQKNMNDFETILAITEITCIHLHQNKNNVTYS